MKLKAIAAGASALALTACLMGAAGCSGSADAKDLQGVWSVEGSNPTVTVVFTADKWKLATGLTYDYTIDAKGKVISYSVDGMSGSSTYEFSEDPRFHVMHVSGHAHPAELREFAEFLLPRAVLPVHTSSPEKCAELLEGFNVLSLLDGEDFSL